MTDLERLARLAAFSDTFRQIGFSFGEWDEIGFRLSDAASAFVRHCYDDGWVLSHFDWPQWKATDEAKQFAECSVILDRADVKSLAKLLTVAIRQDRFVEGGLASWFDSGRLTAIADRAAILTKP